MPISVTATAPGVAALDALGAAVAVAKRGRPLAPVTVIVPTNSAGVMARRALGRRGGIAAVDMLTLYRLAELLGSPSLLDEGRSPVSTPVVDLAIRRVLADAPGAFATVADHPSTVVALRELHRELRLAGPEALAALAAASRRGREAAAISRRTESLLAPKWYDEGDLLQRATAAAGTALPPRLQSTVLFLPQQARRLDTDLLRAVGAVGELHVVLGLTGDADADHEVVALAEGLGHRVSDVPLPSAAAELGVVTTTDADDEVRLAVRAALDAARLRRTPFERIAILWPTDRPYARLVEHHLGAAGIPWNGRPGTGLAERIAPRLLLDLLDVDRRGLRRIDLFALLADLPLRDANGHHLPSAAWERVSRDAGVARDADWAPRLAAWAAAERARDPSGRAGDAEALAAFVDELRATLGSPAERRRWWDWAGWCVEQLERWIGMATLERLDDPERKAWDHTVSVIDRLRHLDQVGPPATRAEFRTTFAAELDVAPLRQGRIGNGITVGALAGAAGLDVDEVIVLGGAEGLLPPRPSPDPLLSDADRAAAGLLGSDAHAQRVHRQLLSMRSTASRITITAPRGDLRSTTHNEISRWVPPLATTSAVVHLASHAAALSATEFPVSPTEHRLRALSTHVQTGEPLATAAPATTDPVLRSALRMRSARRSNELTEYDGDLSSAAVPPIDAPVSPTRLEAWMACPHGYFVRYLLGVYPIEEPGEDVSITPVDKGTALHTALDRFHRSVLAGKFAPAVDGGWTPEHSAALGELFDLVSAEIETAGKTGRPAYWADERATMRADLLEWINRDSELLRSRGARIVSSEQHFGGPVTDTAAPEADTGTGPVVVSITLPSGRRLALRGSIDRVDECADGSLIVTDHKTGRADKFTALTADDPTVGGTRLQLPVYAAAAAAFTGRPDAIVLAEYSFFEKGNYKRIGYRLDAQVWARVREAFASVLDGIESGLYPNVPVQPGFHMFTACDYCEPDHLGTAERWEEWERKRHDPRLARWFADPDDAPGGDDAAVAGAT